MIVHECIPCQHGSHDAHHDVVDPGIEGLIGSGWECPCRGECVEREEKRREELRASGPPTKWDTTDYEAFGEFLKTLPKDSE